MSTGILWIIKFSPIIRELNGNSQRGRDYIPNTLNHVCHYQDTLSIATTSLTTSFLQRSAHFQQGIDETHDQNSFIKVLNAKVSSKLSSSSTLNFQKKTYKKTRKKVLSALSLIRGNSKPKKKIKEIGSVQTWPLYSLSSFSTARKKESSRDPFLYDLRPPQENRPFRYRNGSPAEMIFCCKLCD